MGYWDTSTLVKLYAKEPDSAVFEVQAIWFLLVPCVRGSVHENVRV